MPCPPGLGAPGCCAEAAPQSPLLFPAVMNPRHRPGCGIQPHSHIASKPGLLTRNQCPTSHLDHSLPQQSPMGAECRVHGGRRLWGHSSARPHPQKSSSLLKPIPIGRDVAQVPPVFCRRGWQLRLTPSGPFLGAGIPPYARPARSTIACMRSPPSGGQGGALTERRRQDPTGIRWRGSAGVGMGEGGAGAAPSSPPGPTDLIISGIRLININNSVTEGIWENLMKRPLCKLAALPRNHSSETQGPGEKSSPRP